LLTGSADVLTSWLCESRDPSGCRLEREIPGSIVDYWFWPRLLYAEPDVVLRLGNRIYVIEAKYASGRHDQSVGHESGIEPEETVMDQILQQYRSVEALCQDEQRALHPLGAALVGCKISFVFLVDRRRLRRARREYLESSCALPPVTDCRLLTWQDLYRILRDHDRTERRLRWPGELARYLERAGLDDFCGISHLIPPRSADREVLEAWRGASLRCGERLSNAMRPACALGSQGISRVRAWAPGLTSRYGHDVTVGLGGKRFRFHDLVSALGDVPPRELRRRVAILRLAPAMGDGDG
jgi:hypothetical protein